MNKFRKFLNFFSRKKKEKCTKIQNSPSESINTYINFMDDLDYPDDLNAKLIG
jgi:hypothetical protein